MTAPLLIATAIYVVSVYVVWRRQRLHVITLHSIIDEQQVDLRRLIVFVQVLTQRTATLPCDICGRPLQTSDDQDASAVVRAGPQGQSLLAHPFCAPPMPGEVEHVIGGGL